MFIPKRIFTCRVTYGQVVDQFKGDVPKVYKDPQQYVDYILEKVGVVFLKEDLGMFESYRVTLTHTNIQTYDVEIEEIYVPDKHKYKLTF